MAAESKPMDTETASAQIAKPDASTPESPAEKRKAEQDATPDSKRLKPTPADSAVVKKQVEHYFSDQNLTYDKFFHEKISADKDGWLEMSLILSCNKMKAMRATKEGVIEALKDSILETRDTEGSVPAAVRRPPNLPLPALKEKSTPNQYQKKKPYAHDGGCVVMVKDVPEEQGWQKVKDALRAKLPEKVGIMFASMVTDTNQCILAVMPFDQDMAKLDGMELEVGGVKLKTEICNGELLQKMLKMLPKNIRERREKTARARQKERQRPIVIGSQRFPNIGAVRGRVKTILSSRNDGETLSSEGSDYKLVAALLGYHPRFKEKTEGMTGIKIDKSSVGSSRCFWIVKGDKAEDFSANKCLSALELDPPYANDLASLKDAKPSPIQDQKDDSEAPKEEKKEEAAAEEKKEGSADVPMKD